MGIRRFIGRTPKIIPNLPHCIFPGCEELGVHVHHITYDPEETQPLCEKHHDEITILNMQAARKVRHQLSNPHRWWIWRQWLNGKKVRRTRKSLEQLADWQSRFGR
jgi:hypothetical protein